MEAPLANSAPRIFPPFSPGRRLPTPPRQLSDPAKYGFQPHEITLLGNLCPENLDEATHLIPSLKQHMEEGHEKIDNALTEVHKF